MQPKEAKFCVLRTDGTNCDRETRTSIIKAGGHADIRHINSLITGYDPVRQEEVSIHDYFGLVIAGGFSNGDYLTAGMVFAGILKNELGDQLQKFIEDGKIILGICNGFQVLVKYGLLPGFDGDVEQTVTLTYNKNQTFEDRWVRLAKPSLNHTIDDRCIWTQGIDSIELPVAHGEGRFETSEETYERLVEGSHIVFQYAESDGTPTMDHPQNPNYSMQAIAGICDTTGRIFGLMPHPERYNQPGNHPLASLQRVLGKDYVDRSDSDVAKRLKVAGELPKEGPGLQIFRNGVNHILNNLL